MANTGTDYGAVLEALNDKADRDMDNLANDGKEVVANLGMPSDKYVDLQLPASGGTVTAPADGWMVLSGQYDLGGVGYIRLQKTLSPSFDNLITLTSPDSATVIIPVSSGETITVSYTAINTTLSFFYANGTQHLAPQS